MKQSGLSAGRPALVPLWPVSALLWSATRRQRNDGIGDAVGDAIVDASHGAGIVDDAVGLSALQNGDAAKGPAVGEFARQAKTPRRSCASEQVVEVDDMGAVEVRIAVGRAQIERIISVVEQAHGALFIQRVRVGVGEAYLQAVAQALFHVGLQRVVSGNAGRGVGLRFGRVADVGNAKIDVAAFVGVAGRAGRWAG